MILALPQYLPFFSASNSKYTVIVNRIHNVYLVRWDRLSEEIFIIQIVEDLDVSHFAKWCLAHVYLDVSLLSLGKRESLPLQAL